jgi:hypothetical protein
LQAASSASISASVRPAARTSAFNGLDPTAVSPSAIWRQSTGSLVSISSSKRP